MTSHDSTPIRVLVVSASAHGSTYLIAEEIGRQLVDDGLDADVHDVGTVVAPAGYDAIVMGSAIHDRVWLPQASAFVRANAALLATRPTWLFSVSSVGETSSFFPAPVARVMRRLRREPKTITQLRTVIDLRGHRNFAGAVERSHWNLAGHAFLRFLGGRYGDHRDRADIAAWADGIATQLVARPAAR